MSQSRKPARRRSWLSRQLHTRPLPAWIVALAHLLALGIALVLFALPHHVIPRTRASLGVTISRDAAPTAAPAVEVAAQVAPDQADPAQTEAPVRTGDFSAKFADKFSQGDFTRTESTYVSQNLNITITERQASSARYYVADIYVRDISCFRTAFAKDTYGRNITEDIRSVAMRERSVLSMNGDFYGYRDTGVCVRNGELYWSDDVIRDICVLYWDGRIECFPLGQFDCDREMANGAYQVWNFGPALLDESGNPRTDYDEIYDGLVKNHPRSALGYYEPGHYCFIVADGRVEGSRGLTLNQLAGVAQELGCKQCYNLDGGRTSQLCFIAQVVNHPSEGGRDCSDFLTIVDRVS